MALYLSSRTLNPHCAGSIVVDISKGLMGPVNLSRLFGLMKTHLYVMDGHVRICNDNI